MKTCAFYNEHDPFAAAWLRELIKAGHIAPGEVDERDIRDIPPTDLVGYTQCHFFAGIGVWAYALRRAGWPDSRAVWTGSCPCQPFSQAGEGAGFADERHLWPYWHHLIRVCRPRVVFGEQVASRNGLAWLDLVSADLEGEGYACGAVDLCAAGVGAPHIRQRLWFVAEPKCERLRGAGGERGIPAEAAGRVQGADGERERVWSDARTGGSLVACAVADAPDPYGRSGERGTETGTRTDGEWRRGPASSGQFGVLGHSAPGGQREFRSSLEPGNVRHADSTGHAPGILGYSSRKGLPLSQPEALCGTGRSHERGAVGEPSLPLPGGAPATSPFDGFWGAADWLLCRDGRWRPVEPGSFPLASGLTARVGRLRGYGNGLCAEAATEFIATYLPESLESAP